MSAVVPEERNQRLRKARRPEAMRLLLLAAALGSAALLAAASCSSGRSNPKAWVPSPTRILWPAPPARARIEYLGALRAGAPGGKEPLTERIGRFFAGRKERTMVRPVAIAGNPEGRLVVADPGVPTVHLYDLNSARYSRPKNDAARLLRSPVGVAIGPDGRVFVADSQQCRIFVLGLSGELLDEWGSDILERPTGLALDASGKRLFVVDTLQNQVLCFDMNGRITGRFGNRGTGPGEFNYPVHLSATPDGNLCLTDSMNFRVQVVSAGGAPLLEFGSAGDSPGDFTRPKGIGTDPYGRYYVVDAAFENVQIFDRHGRLLLAFGGPGTGPGELSLPAGVYLGPGNRIYVADSYNRRVQVFRLLEEEG